MQDALEAGVEAAWRELEAGPGEGKGSLRLGLSHERFPQHLFYCLYQGSNNPDTLVATFHFQQAAVEPTKKNVHPLHVLLTPWPLEGQTIYPITCSFCTGSSDLGTQPQWL